MKRPWLLLDCNYLCWRAHHAFKQLSHQEVRTGVPFGFFKDLLSLQDLHMTSRVAFCFDYGKSKRRKIYPGYKADRYHEHDPIKSEVRSQIDRMREEYLPYLGFSNIVAARGYEADDLIASIVQRTLPVSRRSIIVSADRDLYQLLSDRTIIWNPRSGTAYTAGSLADEYGVTPKQWPMVKAMAGCRTDKIDGIAGVGDKIAARFIAGGLKPSSAAYNKCTGVRDLIQLNMRLVKLPFEGTPDVVLYKDNVNPKRWNKLMQKLGIKSLVGAYR